MSTHAEDDELRNLAEKAMTDKKDDGTSDAEAAELYDVPARGVNSGHDGDSRAGTGESGGDR